MSLNGIGKNNKFTSEALHQTVSLHSRSQNQYHAPFDFKFNLDDPSLPEFLELLKKVAHSSSQAEGLRSSNFQANRDLMCSAIWALREEWKPALLAFKWNCHLNDEKVCNLMVWVSATHGKFSTAWSIIRDMHHSSLSTRQAMLIMIDRYAYANNTTKAIQTFNKQMDNPSPSKRAVSLSPSNPRFSSIEITFQRFIEEQELSEGINMQQRLPPTWLNIRISSTAPLRKGWIGTGERAIPRIDAQLQQSQHVVEKYSAL